MILKTIWERYLFRELLKVFFLFLSCFFFLYALIDYSLHMQDFIVEKQIRFGHVTTYYFFQFIKRADLLLPLALLVATLKVLLGINARGEQVALESCGLPRRKILRPFFLLGLLCALFNLISAEFLLPTSLNRLEQFHQKHFRHSKHGHRKERIHALSLKDRSKIVYQHEDKEKKLYLDVFWVRSVDEIWRMHSLSADPANPVGFFVDRLKRNAEGNFEKTESFDRYRFDKFRWETDPTGKGFIPLENRKASELLHMIGNKNKTTAYEHPRALTHFLFKLAIPLLSILVVVAGAPFCLRHSRNLPVFITYAVALFGFIAFFLMMDAAIIMGANQVVPPFIAILAPLALCWVAFGFNYRKTI